MRSRPVSLKLHFAGDFPGWLANDEVEHYGCGDAERVPVFRSRALAGVHFEGNCNNRE